MATFFQLFGFSLLFGSILTATLWPLLWVFGVFQTLAWVESILSRLAGIGSGPIAKTRV